MSGHKPHGCWSRPPCSTGLAPCASFVFPECKVVVQRAIWWFYMVMKMEHRLDLQISKHETSIHASKNSRISGLIISGCKGTFKGQHVIAAKSVKYGIKKVSFYNAWLCDKETGRNTNFMVLIRCNFILIYYTSNWVWGSWLGPTPDSDYFFKLLVRVSNIVSMVISNSVKSYVVISCTTVKIETSVFNTWSVSIIRVNPDK
jgi:hypothetical protein